MSPVTLRLLDKADKEIMKLPRAVMGGVWEFIHKFRHDPATPGLGFKPLKGHTRLFSARINQEYRALLLHTGGSDYLLVSVRHRKSVYENLERLNYRINPVSGGIEVIDLQAATESVGGDTPAPAARAEPLFAAFGRARLLELGVAEPLIPLIEKITTEDELLGLAEYAPQLTTEVLFALHEGKTADEVMEQITRPVSPDEPFDTDDFAAALERPATQVTSSDQAVEAMLGDDFQRWQMFLHPTQRKLVERDYSGPARVSGGPGTGKTIVALRRVKHLIDQMGPGESKPVLLTTFNKNLAADLESRLRQLGGDRADELIKRVDIVNIDKLARMVVAEAGQVAERRVISDDQALLEWRAMLLELPEPPRWDAEFLLTEWTQVILGQALNSRAGYFKARRAGRGKPISRADRAEIWRLTERFTNRLELQGVWTWRQVAERAARVEMERAARIAAYQADKAKAGGELIHREAQSGAWLRHRYQHIVVDEAQDLNAAHWKMLRAMVPSGRNDLFLVGDTHQRIYDNVVSLGALGIQIRGRSARLTLSYRTTREILRLALALLSGEVYDDMDDGDDSLAGYRSILRGGRPELKGFAGWEEELEGIAGQVQSWDDITPSSIAICVPTREMVTKVAYRLAERGIRAVEIGPDGPKSHDGVHVGTMHRFKGLEYQRMIIAGVSDGLVPRRQIRVHEVTDPARYRREWKRDRSLLFVATTRARDAVAIFWHGTPSPFLPTGS